MGLKDRIARAERRLGLQDGELPCEACGGRVVIEEIAPDGTVSYPSGQPCPECGSSGTEGEICWLTYDMRACEDRTEDE